ncbi:glycosyltransferase family 4 protein [Cyanobacteria bacterium FACHB-DQ100]|nr:glycosyltransferase family 4 protein [Cyanobacteria bacterium FACHB-DQ100]
MGADQIQIDVDKLMQQITEDVADRPLIPIPPPASSIIQQPVQMLVRPSLWKRAKGRSKRYALAIARRVKHFGSRARQSLAAKKHKLKAIIVQSKPAPPPIVETPIGSPQPAPTPVVEAPIDPFVNRRDSEIRIAVLTPCLVDGDAVGNDVMGMYHVLMKQGYVCQIFCDVWTTSAVDVKHISQIKSFLTKPSDILIYHYSVGWDAALVPIREIDCKKVIKYHNVTPPQYFENFNPDYTNVCRAGRAQLQTIANIPGATYLSDSAYNAGELLELGVSPENSSVLPPFHHIDSLQFTEPDSSVLSAYHDGKFNILMVGRLAPNKGHAALIEAFHHYYRYYNPNSRLLIVGKADPRLDKYSNFLNQKVAELELANAVVFTGGVSAEALKSYYLVSHAFMITSDHEGFCVPLVEAMSIKLPIVAYGSTAIPHTVDKAGLVWSQADPALLAGSLDRIATSESVSRQLGQLGWQRYEEVFSNRRIEAKFLQLINHLAVESK